jgi:regulator of protease activity HflC (stomatin/prohibitin superfamily)
LLKANAQIAEAEGRAKITKIDADAKANAKRTEAQAEADAINTINSAAANMSENALLLKGFSAIENASASVTLVGKDLNLGGMILPSNRNQP